jgi:hypothetical protein
VDTIYTVIKIAMDKHGDHVLATTEKAFRTHEQAEIYMRSVPALWEESIQGMECSCERAIHITPLE